MKNVAKENQEERSKLYGSLLLFTQTFYKLRTGRNFDISHPICRESHFITICRAFVRVLRGELDLLVINVPPRYGKTELLIHFVAWALARYPDCNFLYTSYSHTLASRQSATIREIMMLREYIDLFKVNIDRSSSAKSDFKTTEGGSVYAAGTGGTLTGMGGGIKGIKRFGGCLLIDDAHKPEEVASDVIRTSVNEWFPGTFESRRNDGNRTPIIFIGQRLHEDDLASKLCEKCRADKTGRKVILSLPGLDAAKNALYPEMHTKEELLIMQEEEPYNFASQIQQDPQPAGGGIYKKDGFKLVDEEPKILASLITCDTAETDKNWNDATVFSFWGVYKVMHGDVETDMYALHWLDCVELRVEPKDLEPEFMTFYSSCMRHRIKPSVAAIEKKSTGVTLVSVLDKIQGLDILGVERTKASGSKTTRFLEMQKYISRGLISFTRGAKHVNMCIDHCAKITANDTHRHDDICDTMYDGVKIVLIDQTFINIYVDSVKKKTDNVCKNLLSASANTMKLKRARKWQ